MMRQELWIPFEEFIFWTDSTTVLKYIQFQDLHCQQNHYTVLLHLHSLLFGVLGWVSVQHIEISGDVRRAI
jgi:hypothetical protein